MKRQKLFSAIITFLLIAVLGVPATVKGEDGVTDSNKFNVVIATDASNSINYTDPSRLRDEATEQFIGLLAEPHVCTLLAFHSVYISEQRISPGF